MLTYYQIAAVIPKMAYVRTLQIFFVSVGQMLNQRYMFRNNSLTQLEKFQYPRTNGLSIYFDSSINFGITITNPILTKAIPMLHQKIFQSKFEFSK